MRKTRILVTASVVALAALISACSPSPSLPQASRYGSDSNPVQWASENTGGYKTKWGPTVTLALVPTSPDTQNMNLPRDIFMREQDFNVDELRFGTDWICLFLRTTVATGLSLEVDFQALGAFGYSAAEAPRIFPGDGGFSKACWDVPGNNRGHFSVKWTGTKPSSAALNYEYWIVQLI